MGWLGGVGVFGLIECSHSLPTLYCILKFNNNNNNNNKKNLVSRGIPAEYSMIDRFLGDAFGVLFCQF